jgi:hypothetical protein
MNIINITQHSASAEQAEQGVVCPHLDKNPFSTALKELLNFKTLPTQVEVRQRAAKIAKMARQLADFARAEGAMIGGAPFLMAPLQDELAKVGLVSLFAFSERVSSEQVVGGETVKTSTFRHIGFVNPCDDSQLDGWWNKVCTQTAAGER